MMLNKDKVLPQTPCECGLVGNEYCAGCAARHAQQEADFQRIKPLIEVAQDALYWYERSGGMMPSGVKQELEKALTQLGEEKP